jgi:hypothetical protein
LNLEEFFALSADVFLCDEIERGIDRVYQEGERIEAERAAVEVELGEFKTCPLCGQNM